MKELEPGGIAALLAGEAALPWQTPRLRALARALPGAAEQSRVPSTNEATWNWPALRDVIWPRVLEHAVDREPGWEELAGAVVAAVDVLAVRAPTGSHDWPLGIARPSPEGGTQALHLGREWRDILDRVAASLPLTPDLRAIEGARRSFDTLRRPEVHALLRGSLPARVFQSTPGPAALEPEGAADVRSLLVELGVTPDGAGWHLATRAEGRSAMAALFLRAVADHHAAPLAPLGDVGITGELDSTGAFLPVADLADKVRRYFAHYPEGTCFVPWAQREALQVLRPERVGLHDFASRRQRDPLRLSTAAWSRLVPVASVHHLLAVLGVSWPASGAARALAAARERSGTVWDWRGQARDVASLADVPMRRRADRLDEERRFHRESVSGLATAAWGLDDDAPLHRVVLTGRPGSGKSMVMRQLHHALGSGSERLRGPSVLVPARRLLAGRPLSAALADELGIDSADADALLTHRLLAPATWLLVDGLDELPLLDRRRVVGLVADWPGPTVVATRGLPEQLPPGDVVDVEDLETYDARKFLEAEGRSDLAEQLGGGAREHRDPTDPLRELRGELARTPLGLSLLAMVWQGAPTSRQQLLRDAVLQLVRRSEADGRLSSAARRRFEREGLRVLGGAAWRMLRQGRAILGVEDLDFALRTQGLPPSEGDLLHEAVEHGGFVQPVGLGYWEFSHKSFAELAAAHFLVAEREDRPWQPPLDALGDPGANEVLLHVAALVNDPGTLIDALLARPDRWLSGLRMATRVLLEVAPGSVSTARLLAVFLPRLRLWCALLDQALPGDLGGLGDAQRAMERHRERLAGQLEALLGACPDVVAAWARDPATEQAKIARSHESRWSVGDYGDPDPKVPQELVQLGSWLHAFFEPARPSLRQKLGTAEGRAALRSVGACEWLDELVDLFVDGEVGSAAREVWWDLTPISNVVRSLGSPPRDPRRRDAVLGVLATRGTPGQRREALLRLCLPEGPGERKGEALVAGLADLDADEILGLWAPAWQIGVLASGRRSSQGESRGLELLYASFVDDAVGPARWRAVHALRSLYPGKGKDYAYREEEVQGRELPGPLVQRLVGSISDPEPAVVGEALALLTEAGVSLSWQVLLPVLLGAESTLRVLVTRAALVGRERMPASLWVHLMAVDFDPKVEEHGRSERGADLPWVEALHRRSDAAFAAVVAHLRAQLATWSGAEELFALGDARGLTPLVDAIADGSSRTFDDGAPCTVLRRALGSQYRAARRWVLKGLGWRSDELVTDEELARLRVDPDPCVAELAAEILDRRRAPLAGWRSREETSRGDSGAAHAPPPAELRESDLFAPIGLSADRPPRATVSIETLRRTTTFSEAWTLLGTAGLETKTWNEMENAGHGDAVDYLEHFMGLAAGHNREVVRDAFEHLRGLYAPEWRDALIDSLGHPSRGLLAQMLLAREAVGRDLLRAIPTSEDAARRVAELAAGTPLALAAVDALVDGMTTGALEVGDGRAEWGYAEPELVRTLKRLGGREALLRLLVRAKAEALRDHAVRALLNEQQPATGEVAEGTATETRRWVMSRMDTAGEDRGRLLLLLALCGGRADADHWMRVSEAGDLSPNELLGVATLVGRCGTGEHAPWLRRLALETVDPTVVNAAFEALAELGGADNAAWMAARLDDPPAAILAARADSQRWEQRRKDRWEREHALRASARESGDERWFDVRLDEPDVDRPEQLRDLSSWEGSARLAIVRHGDDQLGLALAFREAYNTGMVELGEEHGRLPSHALFALGLAANDPGEHVVPFEMTGGGDEVYGSGHPERIRGYVKMMVKRTSAEGVRKAFLEAMLRGFGGHWGDGESFGVIEQVFDGLGGPRPADFHRLLGHLASNPTCPVAMAYLARIGRGETELLDLWRKHGAPWLESS